MNKILFSIALSYLLLIATTAQASCRGIDHEDWMTHPDSVMFKGRVQSVITPELEKPPSIYGVLTHVTFTVLFAHKGVTTDTVDATYTYCAPYCPTSNNGTFRHLKEGEEYYVLVMKDESNRGDPSLSLFNCASRIIPVNDKDGEHELIEELRRMEEKQPK